MGMITANSDTPANTIFRFFPVIVFILAIFLCNRLITFVSSLSEQSSLFLNNTSIVFAAENTPIKENNSENKSLETSPSDPIKQTIVQTDSFKEIKIEYDKNQDPIAPEKLTFKKEYSEEEIQILEKLKIRSKQIDNKEKAIIKNEAILNIIEQRLDGKIIELKSLKNNIKKILHTLDAEQEKQIRSLVKIYESMKPKAAAQIFNELDLSVLIEVVARMKEAKVAPILSFMRPMRVTRITSILAKRKKLPSRTS